MNFQSLYSELFKSRRPYISNLCITDLTDPDPLERVLVWPEEKRAWIEENRCRDRSCVPLVLDALREMSGRDAYAARLTSDGTIVTGPVSSILLRDDDDAEAFVAFLRTEAR